MLRLITDAGAFLGFFLKNEPILTLENCDKNMNNYYIHR